MSRFIPGNQITLLQNVIGDGYIAATPVWINITNKAFGSASKIRVVIINYYDNQAKPSDVVQGTQQIDLTYDAAGMKYTGQAQKLVLSERHTAFAHNLRHEIRW